MAKSAITFQKAKGHSYKHNFRKDEPNYLLEPQDRKENSYWQNEKTPKEIFNDELKKANRKGGRIPKFENSYWEAVCNLNANHNLDDLKKLAEHIEKKFNITCTAIAIHRDEGHYNDKGKAEYNYHAHINFMTYKDGRQNWRKELIKPDDLRELQTETAEILGMERGKDKRETGRERLEHKEYKAIAKEKQALIRELEAEILSKKEIKEQFEAFRKENAGQGLAKEFFRELSDEKKKQLQEPSYTQDELKAYFTELLEKHTSKKKGLFSEKEVIDYEKIIQEQQQTISDLNAKNDNLKQIANKTIEFIDQKVKIDLNAKFDLLKQQNEIQLNEQLENERKKLKKAQLEAEQKQKQASENFNYFLKRSRELRESQAVKEAIAIKDKEIEDIKAKNDQKISELKTENEATKQENIKLYNENKDLKTKLTRYKETIKKLWNKYKSLLKDKLKHKEQDFKQTLADNYNSTKKLAEEFKEIIPEPKKYRIMWIANDGKAMARYFTQSQYNKLDDELKAQCKLIENEPKQQNTKRERKGFER